MARAKSKVRKNGLPRTSASKRPARSGAKRAAPRAKGGVFIERDRIGRFESDPPGFSRSTSSALLVPRPRNPVPPGKLRKGLADAKRELDHSLQEVVETLTGSYGIKEIKLTMSFSAEGKFLGFGAGGAFAMEITVCPKDDE